MEGKNTIARGIGGNGKTLGCKINAASFWELYGDFSDFFDIAQK